MRNWAWIVASFGKCSSRSSLSIFCRFWWLASCSVAVVQHHTRLEHLLCAYSCLISGHVFMFNIWAWIATSVTLENLDLALAIKCVAGKWMVVDLRDTGTQCGCDATDNGSENYQICIYHGDSGSNVDTCQSRPQVCSTCIFGRAQRSSFWSP